jgi:hypothetical protein
VKYALIQMPNRSIIIVDNSGSIGKGRVCRLIEDGGKPAGIIESDLRAGTLQAGFEHHRTTELDSLNLQMQLAREALNGEIQWEQVHPPKPERIDKNETP